MNASFVIAGLVPAVAAAITIALLLRSRVARVLDDQPNERSLHGMPRPRIGGIGIIVGVLLAWTSWRDRDFTLVLLVALVLALVSLADDRRSLPISVRLPLHVAAAIAVAVAWVPASSWILVAIAAGAIAWMTNLFNFMDGADGLAGGMGVIGFATLAAGGAMAGDMPIAWLAFAIASACAGFLAYNFPPSRVFMGDAGSIPLGFLAGALGVVGVSRSSWPAWFPLLAFAPFILDASATLVRRMVKREAFWRAHRSHLYQRLVLSGWTHRRLAAWAYIVMALSSACALAATREAGIGRSVIIWGCTAALLLVFAVLEHRLARSPSPSFPRQDP